MGVINPFKMGNLTYTVSHAIMSVFIVEHIAIAVGGIYIRRDEVLDGMLLSVVRMHTTEHSHGR